MTLFTKRASHSSFSSAAQNPYSKPQPNLQLFPPHYKRMFGQASRSKNSNTSDGHDSQPPPLSCIRGVVAFANVPRAPKLSPSSSTSSYLLLPLPPSTGIMSHVTIYWNTRQLKIKTTPAKPLHEVRAEACEKLGLTPPTSYILKSVLSSWCPPPLS